MLIVYYIINYIKEKMIKIFFSIVFILLTHNAFSELRTVFQSGPK